MSQEPQKPKPRITGPTGQVASQTPIRFAPAIEQIFRYELQGYTQTFSEVTSEYLLFGYCREARENQFLHVLVQGARFAGKIVTEVGISRRKEFPYYKWSDEPKLAVGGVRERTTWLMSGQDFSVRYASHDDLMKALRDLVVGQSAPALRTLGEMAGPHLYREQQTWQPLYEDWVTAEAKARASGGAAQRYPDLVNEEEATDLVQELLMSRKFDQLLGPLKFKYRDSRFFNCHMYLFARGLEFLDPPAAPQQPAPEPVSEEQESDNRSPRMLTWADILGPPPKKEDEGKKKAEQPTPLGDAIAGINGRHPQSMCLELSLDPTERHREFAFLKSLAALEAFYEEGAPG